MPFDLDYYVTSSPKQHMLFCNNEDDIFVQILKNICCPLARKMKRLPHKGTIFGPSSSSKLIEVISPVVGSSFRTRVFSSRASLTSIQNDVE